ncbi:hypothetical protein Rhopal_001682-T1 [Rhodotorula paludigena]|uniref:Uncharacterized protein n=1 Tax=Rhodotorula paludigena TaxID=86838 RepID=A0AAV5G828_9BASI|nr:hypothetical protein Rhopal_001682-T1 [Rhodotorula paludigena]
MSERRPNLDARSRFPPIAPVQKKPSLSTLSDISDTWPPPGLSSRFSDWTPSVDGAQSLVSMRNAADGGSGYDADILNTDQGGSTGPSDVVKVTPPSPTFYSPLIHSCEVEAPGRQPYPHFFLDVPPLASTRSLHGVRPVKPEPSTTPIHRSCPDLRRFTAAVPAIVPPVCA